MSVLGISMMEWITNQQTDGNTQEQKQLYRQLELTKWTRYISRREDRRHLDQTIDRPRADDTKSPKAKPFTRFSENAYIEIQQDTVDMNGW